MPDPAPQIQNVPAADCVAPPVNRRLRGYAFDPSLSIQLDTAVINQAVFRVPWETELAAGPVGEYLEVVDFDPASNCFYAPVDLNSPLVLAQDGLEPSEGNPKFHQQMVYAVAMTTITNFERALGRWALWAPRWDDDASAGEDREKFVRRLRVYPHALREANAYYSPQKKALLFGYFPATTEDSGDHFPGGLVFSCLSHDIIAHETTHALLDGMHRRFIEANHADALAFHEAFADIVALFQHFSLPEVLRQQIAKTRGDLASQNLLGELAQEFGKALGHYGALRDAIGRVDPQTKTWQPLVPDPQQYLTETEPHARGAILVAAVFDAFLAIYKSRVADLLRLASNGTGLITGALHPDLVNRLAAEAARAAGHVLTMCIRALDYCPPVDINFGDYLRALVTADMDLVADDDRRYRVAMIEAFRRRGIFPHDVRTLSQESLCWPGAEQAGAAGVFAPIAKELRDFAGIARFFASRQDVFERTRQARGFLHELIAHRLPDPVAFEKLTGLALAPDRQLEGLARDAHGRPKFEVHSLRPARRIGPDGGTLDQVIISITQKRNLKLATGQPFTFRGGCTLILDLETLSLRYAIVKAIDDQPRLNRQQEFLQSGLGLSLRATYFGPGSAFNDEPFALLHREV